MKERQELLTGILTTRFGEGRVCDSPLDLTTLGKAGLLNEVIRTYKRLGGVLDDPPLAFGKWDICLNGFIVELDEEQHFNRYREITLRSFVYHMACGFDLNDYTKYCRAYENDCLAKAIWGKYWTSPSCEKQFGFADRSGDLSENGSPRWKQRAFYDYLRDVFALINKIPVIRISIYDQIIVKGKICLAGDILNSSSQSGLNEIIKFIELKVRQRT